MAKTGSRLTSFTASLPYWISEANF